MVMLLQRICWNSHGWRGPTGERYGREDSYVGKTGFGHEEWNFNTNDVIDGFAFGYTYYPQGQHPSIGYGPHDIYFFAISPTNERLLIGHYSNAYFLTDDELAEIKQRFMSSTVWDRRIDELVALEVDVIPDRAAAVARLKSDFALNVRIRAVDITPYNPPRALTAEDVDGKDPKHLNRYTKPVFLTHSPVGKPPSHVEDSHLVEDAYVRFTKKQRKVIVRRHNQLSNRFYRWLQRVKASEITAEKDAVDAQCVFKNESYLFELKTVYSQSTRHAIREALGQLLEYSCYPGRDGANHLGIVLDASPGEEELQWLHNVQSIGITVEVFWVQGQDVICSQLAGTPLGAEALGP